MFATPPKINLLHPVSLQEESLAADGLGGGEGLGPGLCADTADRVYWVETGGGGRTFEGSEGV